MVIPAFRDRVRYTKEVASGSIAAAVMARVPVLLDEEELEAYSYLKPPAYILRAEGENEIRALARVRKSRSSQPSEEPDNTQAWEAYEKELYEQNRQVLMRVLNLSLSDAKRALQNKLFPSEQSNT